MRKIGLKLSLVLAACLGLSSAVHGQTVVVGPTTYGPFAGGTSSSFTVPQYSGPGTLVSVELSVTGDSYGGSNAFQNLSEETGTATVQIGSNITLTGPASLVVLTQPSQSNTGTLTANVNPPLTFTGTDAIVVNGLTSSDTESDTLTAPPTSLASYIGAGNVTINYASTVNESSSSTLSPDVTQSTPPTYDFIATVTYTYAVPEPASLSLIGMTSMGLLLRRRARAL